MDSSAMTGILKMLSEKGKVLLVRDGFKFRERRFIKTTSEMSWRCSNKKCKAVLYTIGPDYTFSKTANEHNHEVTTKQVLNRQMLNNTIKRKAQEQGFSEKTRKMITAEIEKDVGFLDTLTDKDMNRIRQNTHRAMRQCMPKVPRSRDEDDKTSIYDKADEELIECVRVYEELYDLSHYKYTDCPHKNQIWSDIGIQLNIDPHKCKQRWESLRSQFKNYLRRKPTSTTHTPWRYQEQIEFLLPHMKDAPILDFKPAENEDRKNLTPTENEDIKLETDELDVEIHHLEEPNESGRQSKDSSCDVETHFLLSNPSTRTRLPEEETIMSSRTFKTEVKEEPLDEMDLFFEYMKTTVQKFSNADKALAKQQIIQVVTELEKKYVN